MTWIKSIGLVAAGLSFFYIVGYGIGYLLVLSKESPEQAFYWMIGIMAVAAVFIIRSMYDDIEIPVDRDW